MYGGDSACLRDLLLINTGCCLAHVFGCGADAFLLAPVYVLLASDEASYVSGARVAVTGGNPIL